MCFHSKQSQSAQELRVRFKAEFLHEEQYTPGIYNGFQYPKTPVITHLHPQTIELLNWGLIPAWAKDSSFRKNTLNARYETLGEKPSFRNIIHNRCLVLADGFYEWQWLDEKGKKKQKFELTVPNGDAFAFAGLWTEWVDKSTGEILKTYTILTTEANELMSRIHNSAKRMPIIVAEKAEQEWLRGGDLVLGNSALVASPI